MTAKSFVTILTMLGLVGLPAFRSAHAQEPPTPAEIDALFAEWDRPGSPGCVLGVVREGEWIHRRGYGSVEVDRLVPLSPSTVFSLSSASKQFVAVAIALLVLDGRLSLDDDVRAHVPELPRHWPTITIRHLIHHTAGISDIVPSVLAGDAPTGVPGSLEEWVERIPNETELEYAPGSRYRSSLVGYHLLALLVERTAGESLEVFIGRRILRPLGMGGARVRQEESPSGELRAVGHRRAGEGRTVPVRSARLGWEVDLSLDDLRRWDELLSGRAIGGEALAGILASRFTLPNGETLANTFGVRVPDYRGTRVIHNSGRLLGFRHFLIHLPDDGLTVLCLCNLETIDPSRLAEDVLELYGVWQTPRQGSGRRDDGPP